MTSGSLNLLETSGPLQACTGIAIPLPEIDKCPESYILINKKRNEPARQAYGPNGDVRGEQLRILNAHKICVLYRSPITRKIKCRELWKETRNIQRVSAKKALRMDRLHDLVEQTASLLMWLGSDLYFRGGVFESLPKYPLCRDACSITQSYQAKAGTVPQITQ
jgi:hypothetical protein